VNGSRRQAREAALQILYFWEVGRAQPQAALEAFFREHRPDADAAVVAFAGRLVHGTVAGLEELDRTIARHSEHWRLDRMAVIDRLILRMAVWELLHESETPPAVVLNEAIELARQFSTEEAVRFVNGVLDAVRRRLGEHPGTP
jgi:N utilization substance protein B